VKYVTLALAFCIAGCSSDDTSSAPAAVASSIDAVSGGSKIAQYGTTLPDPLIVHVKDQHGNSISGVTVTFAVSGTVTLNKYHDTTTTSGGVSVTFSYGLRSGVDTVIATVAGVSTPAIFVETANPGIPGSISVVSGDGQSQTAGMQLPGDLVVLVSDIAGNPVPAADLVWVAATGSPAFTRNGTGADGTAHLQFTPAAGANIVNVSVDLRLLTTMFTATGN
jgi:hypothetical protein